MRSCHNKPRPNSLSLLASCSILHLAAASLSLQELQPIANFPARCENAYKQRIQGCPEADLFPLTGPKSNPAVCSRECFTALQRATANIQSSCQGTSAPPGTVIAHAFTGDLAVWLCSLSNGGDSPPASSSNSGPPASSAQSSENSPTPTGSASTETSPAPSDSKSGSNSASASATASSNLSLSSSTSTSTQTRTQSSATTAATSSKSTTNSSSSSATSSGARPTQTINNGSPFDQVVPNTGSSQLSCNSLNVLLLMIGLVFAVGQV